MTPKTTALRSGGGSLRKPLGSAMRTLDAPAKVQQANASSRLLTAQDAIQVKAKKKKPMHKAISDQMMAGY